MKKKSRQEVNDVQFDARLLSDDNLITVLETKRHCAARSFHSVFWHLTGCVGSENIHLFAVMVGKA